MVKYLSCALLLFVSSASNCMDGFQRIIKKDETKERIWYMILEPDGEFMMATKRLQTDGGWSLSCICSQHGGIINVPLPKLYFDELKARYEQQEHSNADT